MVFVIRYLSRMLPRPLPLPLHRSRPTQRILPPPQLFLRRLLLGELLGGFTNVFLGAFWKPPGRAPGGVLEGMLQGASWGYLGPSSGSLRAILGPVGPFWGSLGLPGNPFG
eukprot:9473231-Pyramimonas_sp.AAC.1